LSFENTLKEGVSENNISFFGYINLSKGEEERRKYWIL
jgi:hypothetical protein